MGNVPRNKPVTAAAADVLLRHTTHTRGGRCLLVCWVPSRLHRVANFDYDALLAARLTSMTTPPKQRSSGSLMALYVPSTNTTDMIVAVESHLEFHRKIDHVWGVIPGLVACDPYVPCMLLVYMMQEIRSRQMWYKTSQSHLCSRRQNGRNRAAYEILQTLDLLLNEDRRVSIQEGILYP